MVQDFEYRISIYVQRVEFCLDVRQLVGFWPTFHFEQTDGV